MLVRLKVLFKAQSGSKSGIVLFSNKIQYVVLFSSTKNMQVSPMNQFLVPEFVLSK